MTNSNIFLGIVVAAVIAVMITLTQQAFAVGGGCSTCAFSFTPKSLSSSLSGTGQHGVEKIFAPGQEAQISGGSASSLSPGQLKP